MASLKEVKGRINSINGTLKITSAMKMVASSKLHKAQEAIENMLPYERRLHRMLTDLLGSGLRVDSPFSVKREVKKVALVVFASNSSLCGGFNMNVIRHLNEWVEKYTAQVGKENIQIYPVGRKVADAVKKMGFTPMGDYQHMSGKPNYREASELAAELMKRFVRGEIQQVELLYNHFKSTSTQVLTQEAFLPIDLGVSNQPDEDTEEITGELADYILEPSVDQLLRELVPKVLHLKLFTALLDSAASEHAARMMAMQMATDNANDLIQDLTLIYNKSRQQAITNELLDIIGGSLA
ncbi:F0F1 ATP synthase subunit gamma [Phocaeicola barnesiae]|uniref:F0F1 ATP synthase subunit gamma n=1 Tax=Phocaeicola barnesiae TaxID=376804 RepID=UPI001D317288|nr:F0F1 ATP synthase subunit gamma [Phocaeicola barnesiae]HJG78113.1 F0F1 ATP synthase subunit gamma [Phocaeicola barnesiae]